jgi:uncharacterized membrane protein HdeD (DUF308 family)
MTVPEPPPGKVVNGARWPAWWMLIRGVITFLLGVAVIVDSLVEKNTATVGKLVVGLLLIGIPSIEDLIRLFKRKG